jgi:galactose mutarotase-like enzyme
MKFSHTEENREGHHLDVLTDEDNGLRIVVSRLGAELVSVARINEGAWVGFLHRDNNIAIPSKGWANHATVMGYYIHRLKDGHSLYRGREIKGGNHGFLRSKTWHFAGPSIRETSASLEYRITPTDFSADEYPLKVGVNLSYRIDAKKVGTFFEFRNEEPELTAHVSFGLHPGFAATSFETFHLQMPRGLYRRHLSPGNYLSGQTRDIEFAGGEMPFARTELPGSIILELVDVPRRQFSYVDPPSGRWVILDLTGVPYLTLWSDGGPFLCIEPCWGLTDHHEQRAFENKEGIQTIVRRGVLRASFSMAPELASCD